MENFVIIGLGGASYTAGIYAFRYGLDPLIIGEMDGGLIVENNQVENFPGFPEPVSGYEIMENMKKQLLRYPARLLQDRVKSVLPIDQNDFKKGYIIETNFKGTFETKALLLAIGTKKRKLGVIGEQEFFGKGVSYCATCDGFFYRNKVVAVVGGGDSALIEAYYLAGICKKVYIIHRRDEFRAEPIRQDKVKNKDNIEIITPAVINEIKGDSKVTGLSLSVGKDKDTFNSSNEIEKIDLELDGVFIAVGTLPASMPGIDEFLARDEKGYIKVSTHKKTNLDGVFAAGDCTNGSGGFRQLITACSEGAVATESAFKYLAHIS